MICGAVKRNGETCLFPQVPCPTHSVDLVARNKRVAESFKKNNPQKFTQQRRDAGKIGFAATALKHGDLASRCAADWRRKNPSLPETYIGQFLTLRGVAHETEVQIGKWFVDFDLGGNRIIEVNGYQSKPSFGESEPRAEKQETKLEFFRASGYDVFVFDWFADRELELTRFEQWLKS